MPPDRSAPKLTRVRRGATVVNYCTVVQSPIPNVKSGNTRAKSITCYSCLLDVVRDHNKMVALTFAVMRDMHAMHMQICDKLCNDVQVSVRVVRQSVKQDWTCWLCCQRQPQR